jgi:hypothetical protein
MEVSSQELYICSLVKTVSSVCAGLHLKPMIIQLLAPNLVDPQGCAFQLNQGCGTRKMQSPEGVNCNMLKWRLNCKQNSTFVPII